jgi:hypothetical protein
MVILPIWIEHALDVAVQRSHDADARDIVSAPEDATRIKASIVACHCAAANTYGGG